MRNTIVFLTLVAGLAAQTISNVQVDSITDSSAHIIWTTSVTGANACGIVKYGLSAGVLDHQTHWNSYDVGSETYRGAALTGLPPSTTIYFQPVSYDSSCANPVAWTCAGAGDTVATTARSTSDAANTKTFTCDRAGEVPHFATLTANSQVLPSAPTVYDPGDVPAITSDYPVASDCSDLSTQLAAAATAANGNPANNYSVTIPAGTVCNLGSLVLPMKTGSNWIVVKSGGNLPAYGTRITPASQPQMATFSRWTSGGGYAPLLKPYSSCDTDTFACTPVATCGSAYCSQGWRFVGIELTGRNTTTADVITPTVAVVSGCLKLTFADAPKWTGRPQFYLTGITGVTPNPNGWSNQYINMYYPDPSTGSIWSTSCSYSGTPGGTPTIYHYDGLTVNGITAGTPNVYQTSQPHNFPTGLYVTVHGAAGVTNANGTGIVTIIDPTHFSIGTNGTGTYTGGGVAAFSPQPYDTMFFAYPDSNNIVLDRCYLHSPNDFPARANYATVFSGNHGALIESYVDQFNYWYGYVDGAYVRNGGSKGWGNDDNYNGAYLVDITSANVLRIRNNYLRGEGILLFSTDSKSLIPNANSQDVLIDLNDIQMTPSHLVTNSGSNGLYYAGVRHWLELKSGVRVKVSGNRFKYCWADESVPSGDCVALTPRMGAESASTPYLSYKAMHDIEFSSNTFDSMSGLFGVVGSDAIIPRSIPVFSRFLVKNNLVTNMNYYTWRTPYSTQPAAGWFLYTQNQMERVTVDHNTVVDAKGSGVVAFTIGQYSVRPYWVRYTNNIFTHANTQGYAPINQDSQTYPVSARPAITTTNNSTWWSTGITRLGTSGVDPNSVMGPNVWVGTTPDPLNCTDYSSSAASCNITPAQQATYWTGFPNSSPTMFHFPSGSTPNARIDAVGWVNRAGGNFALSDSSPYRAGTGVSNDGTDMGVDMAALRAAQGGTVTQSVLSHVLRGVSLRRCTGR